MSCSRTQHGGGRSRSGYRMTMSLCQATCKLFCGEPQHFLWRHHWQHKSDMNFVEKNNWSKLCKDIHWNTLCFVKLKLVFYSKFQIITVAFSYLVSVHSDCIKAYFYYLWWSNAGVELSLSMPQTSFDSRARGYIVFQKVWRVGYFFSVSSVSFQA